MRPTLIGWVIDDITTLAEHRTRWDSWHQKLAEFARSEGYALADVYLDGPAAAGLHEVVERIRRGGIHAIAIAGHATTDDPRLVRLQVRIIDLREQRAA